jgi:hypothetical protein
VYGLNSDELSNTGQADSAAPIRTLQISTSFLALANDTAVIQADPGTIGSDIQITTPVNGLAQALTTLIAIYAYAWTSRGFGVNHSDNGKTERCLGEQ